jgi:hypothetical protein
MYYDLISSGSGLWDQGKQDLFESRIHRGQRDFMNHPVTRGAIDAVTFVVGGGIEGVAALANLGKSLFSKTVAKAGTNVLSKSELLRIKNAATRINKPINVVGSRATGKAGAYSNWDYVIEGINSRNWDKIKNYLPGARSVLDNTPRNIDLLKGHLDPTKPYKTIHNHLSPPIIP